MARPQKPGLEYFPKDTDMYSDRKIRKLLTQKSFKGVIVYEFLLCLIYKDHGYYIQFDNELYFDIADSIRNDITEQEVQEIVNFCFTVDLFDKRQFEVNKIITSSGIQNRYLKAKRGGVIAEENRVIAAITGVITEETPEIGIIAAETEVIAAESTQSKVKEIKEKKNRVNKTTPKKEYDPLIVDLPFGDDVFKEAWVDWIQHRKEIKSPLTPQAVKNQLSAFNGVSVYVAVAMIKKAIASSWKTFYPLSDQDIERLRPALPSRRHTLNDKYAVSTESLKQEELELRKDFYRQQVGSGPYVDVLFPEEISRFYIRNGRPSEGKVIL